MLVRAAVGVSALQRIQQLGAHQRRKRQQLELACGQVRDGRGRALRGLAHGIVAANKSLKGDQARVDGDRPCLPGGQQGRHKRPKVINPVEGASDGPVQVWRTRDGG